MNKIPQFVIRVKLPNSNSYHCSPSGDTEYEEAYNKVLKENIPENFSVVNLRKPFSFPKDNEGFTWILLQYNGDDEKATYYWWEKCIFLERKLTKLKDQLLSFIESLK